MTAYRFSLLALATFAVVALVPPAGHGARAERTLKVTPASGTPTTTFRVAFNPRRSTAALRNGAYRVRMDWRGRRARTCDRTAVVELEFARRGRWKAVRLRPNHPRRSPRWCRGTWIGRIQVVERYEVTCEADEICRDEGSYSDVTTERRFTRRVR